MGALQQMLASSKGASGGGVPVDADAAAFLTATGITDPTISDAIHILVDALKDSGVWAKCHAIYPFVGASAAAHKFNLKDPQDTDAAFRIVWAGTITHDANGVTGNGSSGYGNTKYNPLTHGVEDDFHVSLYCRSVSSFSGSKNDFGGINGDRIQVNLLNASGQAQVFAYDFSGGNTVVTSGSSAAGFWIYTKRASNDAEMYKNGTSIATNTAADGGTRPDKEMTICCVNSGSPANFSDRNLAFCSIGTKLTDTEASDFTTAVEAFQDALSRGVV